MSQNTSVLSYLTTRFATHPENLATEALNFILQRSEAVREAFHRVVAELGIEVPERLSFSTQAADERGARPDLVASESSGRVRIIIEAKFWAGLTERQPVAYLEGLPRNVPGLLLFVAPAARAETLWAELKRRVVAAKIKKLEVLPSRYSGQVQIAKLAGSRHLGLTSWGCLLEVLHDAARTDGDIHAGEDIRQLKSLCARMDSEAFLPLASEELTSTIGRRIIQFNGLVDDLTSRLVACGLASIKNQKSSATASYYVRYMKLNGYAAELHFNPLQWMRWGRSPIWFGVRGPEWEVSPKVSQTYLEKGVESLLDEGGCPQVPIHLPLGVEREAVLDAAGVSEFLCSRRWETCPRRRSALATNRAPRWASRWSSYAMGLVKRSA